MLINQDHTSEALDYVTSDDFVYDTGDDRFRDHLAEVCEQHFAGQNWSWSKVLPFSPQHLVQQACDIYLERA